MDEKERARALDLALSQIEKQFGKGSILRLGSKDAIVPVSVISTGSISLDAALGRGRLAARPHLRDLRTGIVGQNHHRAAGHRRGAEEGRHRGVHRRGARARPGLCEEAGRGRGQPAGLAAGLRRAGAGDHVAPGRLRADRRAGGGFGGGAGAQGRAGGRDGRQPHGRAGAADVAGAAQADRRR